MHKSSAKISCFPFAFRACYFVPALAQAVVRRGWRVGIPLNVSAYLHGQSNQHRRRPVNMTSYVLGPEDQFTVRVFGADDIPDKPAQIDNDGIVTLPMIGQVHAAGLTVKQFQDNR